MLTKERLLHPATIIAVIALLVALSGAGYAATKIGTAQLKNNAVTTPKVKNGAVSTAKLKNNAVSSAKLAGGAVRAADLGNGAVTGAKLADDAVTAAKIAGGAVGTNALANGGVDGAKLGNGAVTNEKLGPNAVTGAKIAGGTITAANIAPGQVVVGKGELTSNRLTLGPAATGNTLLFSLPNVASIEVNCTATGADTTVTNLSGTTLTSTVSGENAVTGGFIDVTQVAAGGTDTLPNAGAGGLQTATWQLAYGAGATSHVATVFVAADGTAAPGTGCAVSAQAVSTS
jgi:hypothetical protein